MKKVVFFIAFVLIFNSCENKQSRPKEEAKKSQYGNQLIGAGASFPYPVYSKLFSRYGKENNISIIYQPLGSGAGIHQLIEKKIDFAATDAFLSDLELKKMPQEVKHIPTYLGAVAITYNVPGVVDLKLTRDLLVDIYLGKINKWNNKRITSVNPGINLPDLIITPIHRADASGTTFIFTDYLSKISKEWKEKIGKDKTVNWLVGPGGKGSEGVNQLVRSISGGIGYVELEYVQNKVSFAFIENKSGNFVKPTLESITAAGNIDIPDDTRISLTDSNNPNAYPISSFSWFLIYKEQNYNYRSRQQALNLVDLIQWIIDNGQTQNKEFNNIPLPKNAIKQAEIILGTITYEGDPLIK